MGHISVLLSETNSDICCDIFSFYHFKFFKSYEFYTIDFKFGKQIQAMRLKIAL